MSSAWTSTTRSGGSAGATDGAELIPLPRTAKVDRWSTAARLGQMGGGTRSARPRRRRQAIGVVRLRRAVRIRVLPVRAAAPAVAPGVRALGQLPKVVAAAPVVLLDHQVELLS